MAFVNGMFVFLRRGGRFLSGFCFFFVGICWFRFLFFVAGVGVFWFLLSIRVSFFVPPSFIFSCFLLQKLYRVRPWFQMEMVKDGKCDYKSVATYIWEEHKKWNLHYHEFLYGTECIFGQNSTRYRDRNFIGCSSAKLPQQTVFISHHYKKQDRTQNTSTMEKVSCAGRTPSRFVEKVNWDNASANGYKSKIFERFLNSCRSTVIMCRRCHSFVHNRGNKKKNLPGRKDDIRNYVDGLAYLYCEYSIPTGKKGDLVGRSDFECTFTVTRAVGHMMAAGVGTDWGRGKLQCVKCVVREIPGMGEIRRLPIHVSFFLFKLKFQINWSAP